VGLGFDFWAGCRIPPLECIFPFSVEYERPDLEQEIGSALSPSHLLALHEST
jgi:hypothetical protein